MYCSSYKKRMLPRGGWMISATCIMPVMALADGPFRSPQPSNIHPDHKFSWGENIGWMNWRDANQTADGVIVRADYLSGYIWCENVGWVNVGNGSGPYGNTDNTDFGVNIDQNDDLDGFAWGENIGWLNFGWADGTDPDRPRFDSTENRFRGWVWSEGVGWINLDDSEHYVAVVAVAECVGDDECCDYDVCTFDECADWSCSNRPNTYGDVDGNGTISIFDVFCVLNGFAGVFSQCTFCNVDIDPCTANGIVNIFDMFAVLNAFSGVDPCCGGLPAPTSAPARQISRRSGVRASKTVISLVPSQQTVSLGELVSVDVLVTGAADLRGYQVAIETTGGRHGHLELEPIAVDQGRRDYVFGRREAVNATDLAGRGVAGRATGD